MIEEIEWYIKARLDPEGRTDRVLIKQRSEYRAFVRERTCHIVATWKDSDFVNDWNYKCSECGCFIPVDERDIETGEVFRAANYCPTCGAKVIKE